MSENRYMQMPQFSNNMPHIGFFLYTKTIFYNCIRLNEIELSTMSKSQMLLVYVCIVVTQILLKRLENYFIFLTPYFKNVFWIIRACSFNVKFFLLVYVYVIYQSTFFMFESYLMMTVECFHISNRSRLFYGNQMHACIYIIIYNQAGQSCTCFTCFPNLYSALITPVNLHFQVNNYLKIHLCDIVIFLIH